MTSVLRSRRPRPRPRLAPFVAGVVLLAAAGCDSSPDRGPADFEVRVEWDAGTPPLGAATFFLSGSGLGEVEPLGGAMAWRHAAPDDQGGVRVLVVHPGTPSSLRFTVRVEDRAAGVPQAALLDLAGQDNERLPVSEAYRVRVSASP